MKPFIDIQDLIDNFNEDEALWRRYQQKRDLRLLRGSWRLFPDEVLDRLDWLEAERERRERRYVGRSIP
ncbi:MAG: hypothetical protein OEV08_14230 [Nitrospira sp.]|nr:hypothetical protein [Nitrospira sp.]